MLRHSLVVKMMCSKTKDANGPRYLPCKGHSLPYTLLDFTAPPCRKLQLRALLFSALFLSLTRFYIVTASRTRTREKLNNCHNVDYAN